MTAGQRNCSIEINDLSSKYRVDDVVFALHASVSEPAELGAMLLKLLTDEQRMEVFGKFCRSCGCDDPRCQCGNDE